MTPARVRIAAASNVDGGDPNAIGEESRNSDTRNLTRCPDDIERRKDPSAHVIRHSSLHDRASAPINRGNRNGPISASKPIARRSQENWPGCKCRCRLDKTTRSAAVPPVAKEASPWTRRRGRTNRSFRAYLNPSRASAQNPPIAPCSSPCSARKRAGSRRSMSAEKTNVAALKRNAGVVP